MAGGSVHIGCDAKYDCDHSPELFVRRHQLLRFLTAYIPVFRIGGRTIPHSRRHFAPGTSTPLILKTVAPTTTLVYRHQSHFNFSRHLFQLVKAFIPASLGLLPSLVKVFIKFSQDIYSS